MCLCVVRFFARDLFFKKRVFDFSHVCPTYHTSFFERDFITRHKTTTTTTHNNTQLLLLLLLVSLLQKEREEEEEEDVIE